MSRSLDRFLDWLSNEPAQETQALLKAGITEDMVIIPGEPTLQISFKLGDMLLLQKRLNLAAVDDLIGKLLDKRDQVAQMKDN